MQTISEPLLETPEQVVEVPESSDSEESPNGLLGLSRMTICVLFQVYAACVLGYTWTYIGRAFVDAVFFLCAEFMLFWYVKGAAIYKKLKEQPEVCHRQWAWAIGYLPLLCLIDSVALSVLYGSRIFLEDSIIVKAHCAIAFITSLSYTVLRILDKLQQTWCGEEATETTFLARASGRSLEKLVHRPEAKNEVFYFCPNVIAVLTPVYVFALFCARAIVVEAPSHVCSVDRVYLRPDTAWQNRLPWIGRYNFMDMFWKDGLRTVQEEEKCLVVANVDMEGVIYLVSAGVALVLCLLAVSHMCSVLLSSCLLSCTRFKAWLEWFVSNCIIRGHYSLGLAVLYVGVIPYFEAHMQNGLKSRVQRHFTHQLILWELIVINIYLRTSVKLYEAIVAGNATNTDEKVEPSPTEKVLEDAVTV